MNVGRLRQLIANLPDDAPILIYGHDGRFVDAEGVYVAEVVAVKSGGPSSKRKDYFIADDYSQCDWLRDDYPNPDEPMSALVIE